VSIHTRSGERAGHRRASLRVPPDLIALAASATVALLVGFLVVVNEPARVDRLEIRNETELRLTVSVRGEGEWGATPIAYVWPGATDVATDFPDPGATWVLHLSSQHGRSTEVKVARSDLEGAAWTYDIEPDVAQLLGPWRAIALTEDREL
jgi:hypothetical protein